jgi:hypothetical protein
MARQAARAGAIDPMTSRQADAALGYRGAQPDAARNRLFEMR